MSPWETAGALTGDGGFNDYPADLYLQAKDLEGTHAESAVDVVKNQRSTLLRRTEMKIRNMQLAVGAVRPFDGTGHAGEALGHIEATFRELKRTVNLLVEDIEGAEAAYVDNLRERLGEHGTKRADAAVEPSPQAPAAPADDSSPVPPIAGEETAGAAVTPNAAAPAMPAGTDVATDTAREGHWAAPKPGPGTVTVTLGTQAAIAGDLARMRHRVAMGKAGLL